MLDGQKVDAFNSCTAIFCNDPRFNWAPECWFAANVNGNGGSGNLKSEWLKQIEGLLGNDGSDRDIFMFTSDQEYLQSPGELMFLPYLGWRNGDRVEVFRSALAGNLDGLPVYDRRSAGQGPCKDMFWTSYEPADVYGFDGQMEVVAGTGDFRVNPFSDDVRVLMAALANAPLNWWAASTNFVNDTARQSGWKKKNALIDRDVIDLDKATEYAFGDGSDQAKLKHGKLDQSGKAENGTLMEVAEKLRNAMRGSNGNWERAYDDFGWDIQSDEKMLGGVNLDWHR